MGVGRRGAFLLLFGLAYAGIGLSYVFAEPTAPIREAMVWLPSWSPLWACGVAFVAAGGVALVCAFLPLPGDRFGFMALASISAAWAVANVVSWQAEHQARGWVTAIVFAAVGGAVLVVSGMPNPVRKTSQ